MAENATADKTEDTTILNTQVADAKTDEGKLYDKSADAQTTSAADKSAADKAIADKAASDKAASEKAAADKAKADAATKTATDKTTDTTQTTTKQDDKTTSAKVETTSTDYDLKLPDGSPLSEEDRAATLKDAKAAGLTKEEAEGMLETKDQTARNVIARQNAAYAAEKKTWPDIASKDPEIGGENYARNIEQAARAWQKLASPKLQELCDEKHSGLGSHPELIRLMVRVSRIISEDRLVLGTTGAVPSKKSKEDIMYGNPKPATEAMV